MPLGTRNPLLTLEHNSNKISIQVIGDPHLGKTFRTGVPTSQFGKREQSILQSFRDYLNPKESVDFVVVVGDLFDKFVVRPNVVQDAVEVLEEACLDNTDITYIVIPGNHDLSKDNTKVSSYYLFYQIMIRANHSNLKIIYDESQVFEYKDFLFYLDAYDPFHSEKEPQNPLDGIDTDKHVISIGHWDDINSDFGSYYPSPELLSSSNTLISGHIHTPTQYSRKGTKIYYAGSLQPYSHGEDPYNELYETISYTDLEKLIEKDNKKFNDLKSKNIRINCYPGYLFPYPVTFLSTIYNNVLDKPIASDDNKKDTSEQKKGKNITDFTNLYLHNLKEDYQIEDELLLKIHNFLKDSSEDVSFNLD